jgi:hypothetical protein
MAAKVRMMEISDEELALLDGKCRPALQLDVDKAVDRLQYVTNGPTNLTPEQRSFVGEVVAIATREMSAYYREVFVHKCSCCDRGGEYTKYRSGIKKGRPNRQRPIKIAAISYCFWSADACTECAEAIHEYLVSSLADIPAALDDALLASPDQVNYPALKDGACVSKLSL